VIRTSRATLPHRMSPWGSGLVLFLFFSAFSAAQVTQVTGSTLSAQQPAASSTNSTGALSTALSAQQNPFLGSRPQGQPTPGVIDLTILDAINRGLQNNLGLFLTERGTDQARAAQLRSRSELLPKINGDIREQEQQNNLAALGLPTNLGIAPIVGPFGIFDARATLTESLINFRNINNHRAARENVNAAQFTYRNARDIVVLVVGGTYLQAVASSSRVDAAKAQVQTAKSLYDRALDLKRTGIVAGIDVVRANVEYQTQQQRLIVAQNQFEKDKLQLARVIGLPTGQQFRLTDQIPYSPAPDTTLESSLARAFENRGDYLSAQAAVRSAEISRAAASAQRLPSLNFNGDYGVLGRRPTESHGTFTAAASLNFPIFQGGKIRADEQQAEAILQQQRAQLDDLRERIEFEVRSALLDLRSSNDQVAVAKNALDLAREEVAQAQDRFTAGVTNNIEVVQAQDALAATNENFISALYSFNFAKLSLARAVGIAEQATKAYLGGK
jgi:outer membrane protein TolC